MKLAGIVASMAAVALTGLTGTFVLAQQQKSQWEGVYTVGQAERGGKVYVARCIQCHATDLTGYIDDETAQAPELVGEPFVKTWDNHTLGELLDLIQKTMPRDEPGILKPQDYADVLAYILSYGQYPAGSTELPPDVEALKAIKFLGKNIVQ
jgi:cytochrome c